MELGSSLSQSAPAALPRAINRGISSRFAASLVIGTLTALFAVTNWLWLRANVVTYSGDRMAHLIRTLSYDTILRTISLHALFEALVLSGYHPPLVHYVAVAAYKLFGVDEDLAALTNLLYVPLLLWATWRLGQRAGGTGVAAVATLAIATFPIIYAMSRYFYLDFALACFVAASVALLVESERFSRRRPSLLFGLAFAGALLVKWTAVSFVAGPLAVVLWRSSLLGHALRHPSAPRPNWRRLALALLGGMALAALLVWPARDIAIRDTPFGLGLIVLYGLLIAFVAYALFPGGEGTKGTDGVSTPSVPSVPSVPSSPLRLANALSAAAVAALVAGIWYLPNIHFIYGFFFTAYGKPTGRFWAFGEYATAVVGEHLSPLYTLLFGCAAAGLLWAWLRHGGWRRLRALDDIWLVFLTWTVIPTLIFAGYVSTAHSRYLMPFLPPFAVWIALGLARVRPPALRAALLGAVTLLAGAQFAIVSFDQLGAWRDRFVVRLPAGPANLLAHGFNVQYPAAGVTDPRYALAPEILGILEQKRVASGRERVMLSSIVNILQLHEPHFLYQIYVRYPQIFLRDLTHNELGRPTYPQLFEMDFVLLTSRYTAGDERYDDEAQQTSRRILSSRDDLFRRAFVENRRWVLPDGETIMLFERRFADVPPGIYPENYHTLMQTLGPQLGPGDALILTSPDQVYIVGQLLPKESPVAALPLPTVGANAEQTIRALESLAGRHKRLFLVSHNAEVVDPEGQIEGWLRANTLPGPESWVEAVRVAAFVPGRPASAPGVALDARFQLAGEPSGAAASPATLSGASIGAADAGRDGAAFRGGDAVPVTLFWELSGETADLKVSVQLVGLDGALVTQRDASLSDGAQPHALLIPREAAPGAYRLLVSVYDANSLGRLLLPDGRDAVELYTLHLGAD
ncbi:MAG TPA: glycosyltransferase family 39 protein [Ardenticatenaceae bacterium]|nr:glycosyltransferase family 39 protein [Ardenticatenaceae bacterium]